MDVYKETKKDYEKGIEWHIKRNLSYSWKQQINKFAKNLKGKRILDAGCGSSVRDIREFVRMGFQVDGLDYSEKIIKKCKSIFPKANFYVGDMRKMNLPENKYDGVWVCTSILNLKKKDLPLALSEFKRVLKSHGKLFISVKKGSGERIIPDKFGKRFFSFYSLNELKELVSKSGFKITYTEVVPDAELAVKDPKEPKPDLICLYAEK